MLFSFLCNTIASGNVSNCKCWVPLEMCWHRRAENVLYTVMASGTNDPTIILRALIIRRPNISLNNFIQFNFKIVSCGWILSNIPKANWFKGDSSRKKESVYIMRLHIVTKDRQRNPPWDGMYRIKVDIDCCVVTRDIIYEGRLHRKMVH